MATDNQTGEDGSGEASRSKLSDAIAELRACREKRTSRKRHGAGELVQRSGVLQQATGCLLLDGTRSDACCLTWQYDVADPDRVWSRLFGPGQMLRRRGRLQVEQGVVLHFIDEAAADIPGASWPMDTPADLERDMAMSVRFRTLVERSELFGDAWEFLQRCTLAQHPAPVSDRARPIKLLG